MKQRLCVIAIVLLLSVPDCAALAIGSEPYITSRPRRPLGADVDTLLSSRGEALTPVVDARRASDPTEHSEWLAMLVAILKGSRLDATEGWFSLAVAEKRWTWAKVLAKYDRNHDGRIDAREFPGPSTDFARLDRDASGDLTQDDFDWIVHEDAQSSAFRRHQIAGRGGEGRSREEASALFNSASAAPHSDRASTPLRQQKVQIVSNWPTRATLLRGLFCQEIGALQRGPSIEGVAPDFRLATPEGTNTVVLSKVVGTKPIVLVFGNFTCGPFRSQAASIERIYLRYRDRADFYMVYVREAHPIEGWRMQSNDRYNICVSQPQTLQQRRAIAARCRAHLQLDLAMLVDSIDDTVGSRYSGMPSRLYVIDQNGKIAYKSGRGPFGFKPAEMEQSLILVLAESQFKLQ
jgi:hypothetical protein